MEVFADGGSAYTDLSQIKGIYGGGVRLNLFSQTVGTFGNAYAAIEGEWIGGALETTYRASSGRKWEKETDWSMFPVKTEVGLVMERFSLYGGVSWINYKEETTRRLRNIGAIGTTVVHWDDLKEKESWGMFGGIDVRFMHNLMLTVEGQIANVKQIFGTVTYHF